MMEDSSIIYKNDMEKLFKNGRDFPNKQCDLSMQLTITQP